MTIKVLLAEDHTIVRKGLRSLLDPVADIQVVGEAENGREALEKVVPEGGQLGGTSRGAEGTWSALAQHPSDGVAAVSSLACDLSDRLTLFVKQ